MKMICKILIGNYSVYVRDGISTHTFSKFNYLTPEMLSYEWRIVVLYVNINTGYLITYKWTPTEIYQNMMEDDMLIHWEIWLLHIA